MMKYLIYTTLILGIWNKFNRISEINTLKETAANYYTEGVYTESIIKYEKLIDEYGEDDEKVKLNLGNCYFNLKLYTGASDYYLQLVHSTDAKIKSQAFLQLGVISVNNKKKEVGLNYFKEALKAYSDNEEARFNYELLKKEINSQRQQEQSFDKKKENPNGKNSTSATENNEIQKSDKKGEENSVPEEYDSGSGDGEEVDYQLDETGKKSSDALVSKRMEEVNMSEHQAKTLLNAIRNAEIQYIQQRPQGNVDYKKEVGKPDW
jgi:Ca-activated chloride channel family protein